MKFSVVFEKDVWVIQVESTDPGVEYFEEFEVTELAEARQAVWELVEQITKEDDEFEEDEWGETEDD